VVELVNLLWGDFLHGARVHESQGGDWDRAQGPAGLWLLVWGGRTWAWWSTEQWPAGYSDFRHFFLKKEGKKFFFYKFIFFILFFNFFPTVFFLSTTWSWSATWEKNPAG